MLQTPFRTPSPLKGLWSIHRIMVFCDMCACQNYGPLLGPLYTRCRIILRTQKGTIILTTTHMIAGPNFKVHLVLQVAPPDSLSTVPYRPQLPNGILLGPFPAALYRPLVLLYRPVPVAMASCTVLCHVCYRPPLLHILYNGTPAFSAVLHCPVPSSTVFYRLLPSCCPPFRPVYRVFCSTVFCNATKGSAQESGLHLEFRIRGRRPCRCVEFRNLSKLPNAACADAATLL